jgi:hypothetical protein
MKFVFPLASMKDVQATGEAFGPQKRKSSTYPYNFYTLFIFVGHLCPPGSGSALPIRIQISGSSRLKSMRIWILHNTEKKKQCCGSGDVYPGSRILIFIYPGSEKNKKEEGAIFFLPFCSNKFHKIEKDFIFEKVQQKFEPTCIEFKYFNPFYPDFVTKLLEIWV